MPTDSPAHRLLPHLRRIARVRTDDLGDGPLLGSFVASHDEDAFAALVRRHGPMVLGVCRRVVGDAHLAEDAFQATFLVLARRAAVVRPRHLVGPWLYGVAYRTALKARGSAARRQAKEKQVDAMPHPAVSPTDRWADLQPILDAELARLPEKYRVPVILCDLNGRPQRDVARELKLSATTLTRRLASARRLLAKRLTDRGVVLSAGAVASALGWHAATAAVSSALASATVKAACAAAAGTAVGLPGPVVQLSEGVMRMFVLQKLKTVATGAAVGLVLLVGIGVFAGPTLRAEPDAKPIADPPAKVPPTPAADPAPKPESEDAKFFRRTSLDIRGTMPTHLELSYFVADADGKKRAKVVEWMLLGHASRKATAACQSCHQKPDGNKFSAFQKFFRNTGGDAGVGFADFDQDGWLDVLVTGAWKNKVSPDKEALKAEEQKARAAVLAAEAELRQVETLAKKGLLPSSEVEKARAKHKAAQAVAEAAGLRRLTAEQVEKTDKASPPKTDASRIAEDVDRLILGQWLGERVTKTQPTDAEYLRRLLLDLTGGPPTNVEMQYFLADPDPKKREKVLKLVLAQTKAGSGGKLIEELLSDPEVQKRWHELWQQRLYKEQIEAAYRALAKAAPDRLDRLLGELLAGKKADEQILEALCLATVARYPTETERRVILDGVKAQPDRSAAWGGVLKALATTAEAKAHAEGLANGGK